MSSVQNQTHDASEYVTHAQLREVVDEILLPAVDTIVEYKLIESEKRTQKMMKTEIKKEVSKAVKEEIQQEVPKAVRKEMQNGVREIVQEEMQPWMNKMMGMLEKIVADIDDLKTEKVAGDYLFSEQRGKLNTHEKKITNLDTRVSHLEEKV